MFSASTQLLLGSNGLPDVQIHRQRLQTRIAEVEAELAALKRRHNTFSPINALPGEVLSNVLLMHARDVMAQYPTWHKKSISWIHSTQILFVTPELAHVMLYLSKQAPVNVETLVRGTAFTDVFSKIFSQSHRLHKLNLSGVAHPAILSSLTTPAPILKKLILSAGSEHAVDLPAGFLNGCAPSLQHLEVRRLGAQMWGALPLSSSIIHVELTSALAGTSGVSPKDLLKSLSRMPLLQFLSFTNVLPRDGSVYPQDAQPEFPPIHCPALQTLNLSDSISAITAFLRAVDVPTETRVRIHFNQMISATRYLEDFLDILVASWVEKRRTAVKGIIVCDRYKNYGLGGTLDVKYFFGCPPVHECDAPDLSISFFDPRSKTGEYLSLLNQYIDVFWLTYLMVEGKSQYLTSEVWLSAFSHLRNLETITIRNRPIVHFLDALQDTSSQLPFPSLSTLDLFEIDFLAGYTPRRQSLVGDLVDALASRAVVCPIGFLRLVECKHFSTVDYAFLRGSLPDLLVEWDEHLLEDD